MEEVMDDERHAPRSQEVPDAVFVLTVRAV